MNCESTYYMKGSWEHKMQWSQRIFYGTIWKQRHRRRVTCRPKKRHEMHCCNAASNFFLEEIQKLILEDESEKKKLLQRMLTNNMEIINFFLPESCESNREWIINRQNTFKHVNINVVNICVVDLSKTEQTKSCVALFFSGSATKWLAYYF